MGSSIPIQEFERAYRREATYVAALMGRLAVPDEAIHDAVQDVFVAAYRRWPDFDRSRAVRPWLTGFARHVAFRYRRSAARRHRRGLALAVEHSDQAEPGPHHQTHARDFLTRFLATMDPGHRQAFLLSEYEGRTGPEIAEALDISIEAAYGRVRTARRRLKQALMDDVGSTDPRAAGFVPPWGLVLARLQQDVPAATATTATATATGTTGTGLMLKMTGWALACAAGLAVVSSLPSDPNPVAAHEGETTSSPRPEPARAVLPASDADGQVAMRTPIEPPAPRGTISAEPVSANPTADRRQASDPAAKRAGAPRPSGSEPRAPDPAEASAAPSSPDRESSASLAEEAALLREARRLLDEGDGTRALQRLSEHARSFPRGQLTDARERTRIRALCDLGRIDDARARASRMVAAAPDDPLARQALSICTDPIQNDAEPENQDR